MTLSILKEKIKKIKLLSYLVRKVRFYFIRSSNYRITKAGFKFIGPEEMISGDFEKDEFSFFCKEIVNSDLFINIGANIGYYTCAAINSDIKVLAFEPDINNFNLLKHNIQLSKKPDNCLPFNLGVGSQWCSLKIYHASTGSSFINGWANNSSLFFNETNIIRVDDLQLGNYKHLFFLVDVEGFESEVIQGARLTLGLLLNQTWMIEIMTSDEYGSLEGFSDKQVGLVEVFEEHSFELYSLKENGIEGVKYHELKSCIKNRDSYLGHNFIFKKVHNG